jgi:hypothetical protein
MAGLLGLTVTACAPGAAASPAGVAATFPSPEAPTPEASLASTTPVWAPTSAPPAPAAATAGPINVSPAPTALPLPGADNPSPAERASPRGPASPAANTRGLFPGGLLIADRGNGRLLVVNGAGRILWQFPVAGSLPLGQAFAADDAFVAPDGRTITANEEYLHVVVRIDIASRRVIWEYGHYRVTGAAAGYLNRPDDAYPLANGDVVLADIRNCRVIEIAPDKRIVRQWGRTGVCVDDPPYA